MNKLSTAKRVAVVAALVEGNSVRATARMTNVSKPTILKLLSELGDACARYHSENVRDRQSKWIECDEIWQFCYAKAKNVPKDGHKVYINAVEDAFGADVDYAMLTKVYGTAPENERRTRRGRAPRRFSVAPRR